METDKRHVLGPNISPAAAWAFAIGTSIGWGSMVVTNSAYLAQAGILGSVLGMVLGTAVMLVIARNYAYMMRCYPEAGGAYTYAKEVFGYDHSFLLAWFLALTYLSILWANATSLPLFARYFLGEVFRFGLLYTLFGYDVYLGEALLPIAALLLTALLCMNRRNLAAGLMVVMAAVFTICITGVFLASILQLDRPLTPAYVPESGALSQVARIAVTSPWAFIGFECISHAGEEFSFRHSRIFRVLVIAVLSTMALYLFVILLSVTAYPPEYDSWLSYIRDLDNLSGLEALPAFYAAQHYLGGVGVTALMTALICLILTSLIGNMTAISRLFYAMGKDEVLPARFAVINDRGAPGCALLLAACVSLPIPFLGRTAIGWIVDVTTIGATIIYAFVSAAARKLAKHRGDRREEWTGLLGLALMLVYLTCQLAPNLAAQGTMAKETFFLFIVWSIFGFLYFRSILKRDHDRRFGKSVIVWMALLTLVLFTALIWMRQSMLISERQMMDNIRIHYMTTADASTVRIADEVFIAEQADALENANTRTILMATGMFVFALAIMMSNYSFMTRQTQESEKIANTDAMTGVKSKHAYILREQALNETIRKGMAGEFAIVVCDVNGLKYINDNYGHKAGDECIRAACAMICELFDHSPVFRVGGDEFVVLLQGRDFENRAALMESLQKQSESHIATGQAVVSAGASDFISGTDADCRAVFERADRLMYQNKFALKNMGATTR